MSVEVADLSNTTDREMFCRILGENGLREIPDGLATKLLRCQIPVHFKVADRLGVPHGSSFGEAAQRILKLKDARGVA